MKLFNRSISKKLVLYAIGVGSMTISFQNCTGGFQAIAPLSSLDSSSSSLFVTPVITLAKPIPSLSNIRTFNIMISASTDPRATIASITCQLDKNAPVNCTNQTFPLTDLPDGDHSLQITATDSKGNLSEKKIFNFRIDASAPVVTISEAPALNTGSTSASISFMATDAMSSISSLQCSLDNAAYAACTSPYSKSGLSAGAHIFRIRAYDLANNISVEKSASWTVTLGVPIMNITAKPKPFENTPAANFSFSGTIDNIALASYSCSLDGSAYLPCTSPKPYTALPQGKHDFSVRGVSSSGTTSDPVSVSWVVDTIAPSTPILTSNVTSPTTQTSASISFTSSDAGSMVASYQCSVDGGAYSACTSPKPFNALPPGAHSLQVKATDTATNVSLVGTYNWTINTLPVAYDGVALYNTHCAVCHQSLATSTKLNRTAAEIQGAIDIFPQMAALKPLLAPQVNAIAMALVKVMPTPPPELCPPNAVPAPIPASVRLLTSRELTNSVSDILGTSVLLTKGAFVKQEGKEGFDNETAFLSIDGLTFEKLLLISQSVATEFAKKTPTGIASCLSTAPAPGGPASLACSKAVVLNAATLAYRRPLVQIETSQLGTLVDNSFAGAAANDKYVASTEAGIIAVLLSPQFLYYLPRSATEGEAGAPANLADWELAGRMAGMLWGSVPDANLRASAANGSLRSQSLSTQLDRMLKDIKGSRFYEGFFAQWLGLYKLEGWNADKVTYPTWSASLLQSMRTETETFALNVAKGNKSPIDLIDARYSYLDENMAKHYGIGGVTGTSFREVALPSNRAGLLTQASFLTVTSASNHTSPIRRGNWTLARILCDPPAPPPPNVKPLPMEPGTGITEPSIRALLASHSTNPVCASCHTKMDPIGLSYENYNGIGEYRSTYKDGTTVDATTGRLPNGQSFQNILEMQRSFETSEEFKNCFTTKLITYATGNSVPKGTFVCESKPVKDLIVREKGFQDVLKALLQSPFLK